MLKINWLLIFLPCLCFAQSFKQGEGSLFTLKMKDGPSADLSIYFTDVKEKSVSIEYYFTLQNSFIPVKMWQQFELEIIKDSPLKVINGFVKTANMKSAEKLTPDYLHVNDGVEVNDFLFSDQKVITQDKVGEETLKTPAGEVKAVHYRKARNDQTVDFWISDSAKPIGLVKLISSSPKKVEHNYQIDLASIIKNVKPSIDPKTATPLSERGKAVLANPVKGMLMDTLGQ